MMSYSMGTLDSWSKKITAIGIHSSIFIFHGLILLPVAKISEQPLYIFANISGLGEYFSKLIFALKHWVQAGRFEYKIPIILRIFSNL